MKNLFRIIAVMTVAMLLVTTSCKKDDDDPTPTPYEYLTAGDWKITGMEFNPGIDIGLGIVITDIYNDFMEDCSKDDLMTFNTDGTLTEDEGPTKCDPEDPQTTNDATWTLTDNDKTLTMIDPDFGPSSATVLVLNETTLKLSSTDIPDIGLETDDVTVIITMTLQK